MQTRFTYGKPQCRADALEILRRRSWNPNASCCSISTSNVSEAYWPYLISYPTATVETGIPSQALQRRTSGCLLHQILKRGQNKVGRALASVLKEIFDRADRDRNKGTENLPWPGHQMHDPICTWQPYMIKYKGISVVYRVSEKGANSSSLWVLRTVLQGSPESSWLGHQIQLCAAPAVIWPHHSRIRTPAEG